MSLACSRASVCAHDTRIQHLLYIHGWYTNLFKDKQVQNLKSLLSGLQHNAEDLFIKSTFCFKGDLDRLRLDETMALAFEQYLLNMSSLRLHDLLYCLSLFWWYNLVLRSLQELYSRQPTTLCCRHLRQNSTYQERAADILRVIDGAAHRVHLRNILHGTAHEFVHIAQLELMRPRFRQAGQVGDSVQRGACRKRG